jgi:hypothetical protein
MLGAEPGEFIVVEPEICHGKPTFKGTRIMALLISICFIDACSKEPPLSMNAVSGTYVIKYNHGTETLELNQDGTYFQRYAPAASQTMITNASLWSFDSQEDKITLRNVFVFDTGFDEPRQPTNKTMGWHMPVIRDGNKLKIPIDVDHALMFEKQ